MYKYKGLFRLLAIAIAVFPLSVFGLSASAIAQTLTANPGTIYFGDMSVDQSGITRELRFENTGQTSLTIESIEITGPHAAQFFVESGTISDPISPGSSALFLIRATPTSFPTRYMEASVEVSTSDGDVTVAMHATSRLPGLYYVSPSGDDSNPGTSAFPWKTIQTASGLTVPGDTVFVEDGIYEGPITLARSGMPDAYVTFKSVNKWGAKVQITDGEGAQDGIKVVANYITVDGFELYDPAPGPGRIGNGITIYEAHHVNAVNNKIYDFGASGIQGAYCDHVLIENNVVYENAKYNPTQSSGISIWLPLAVDDEPGYHIIIRNNRSFSNTTITKNENGINSDGNGIIIDKAWNSIDGVPYPHRTLIENNLAYNNGGSGIHVHKSSHIDIINNTSYHNRQNPEVKGSWRGELYTNRSSDTVWRNNIAVAKPGDGYMEYNRAIFAYGAEDVTFENNITFSTDPENTYSFTLLESDVTDQELIDNNLPGMNPRFVDPDNGDFSIQGNSPAVDAGSDDIVSMNDINYLARVLGTIDVGAFEFYTETVQVDLASFEALVVDHDIQIRWVTASELNTAGFSVEMRARQGDFSEARYLQGRGAMANERIYETTLQDLTPGSYSLRLKKVGIDGTYKYSETIEAIVDDNLPVELTSFNAVTSDTDIHLNWTTASELNNAGFAVELQAAGGAFEQVLFEEGQGTTDVAQSYSTTLYDIAPGTYSVRLKQIDFDGTFAFSDTVQVTVGTADFVLAQSYPNPFNPQTQIPYTLPIRSQVVLEVFDLLGRRIRTLVNEEQDAGAYSVRFDAGDLPNGTYAYRLKAGGFTQTNTMVLLK